MAQHFRYPVICFLREGRKNFIRFAKRHDSGKEHPVSSTSPSFLWNYVKLFLLPSFCPKSHLFSTAKFIFGLITHRSKLSSYSLPLDVCSVALNRCLQRSDTLSQDHPDYYIALEYEFLDDVYNDWVLDAVRLDSVEGKGRGDLMSTREVKHQLKKKCNHTLTVMVSKSVIVYAKCIITKRNLEFI